MFNCSYLLLVARPSIGEDHQAGLMVLLRRNVTDIAAAQAAVVARCRLARYKLLIFLSLSIASSDVYCYYFRKT